MKKQRGTIRFLVIQALAVLTVSACAGGDGASKSAGANPFGCQRRATSDGICEAVQPKWNRWACEKAADKKVEGCDIIGGGYCCRDGIDPTAPGSGNSACAVPADPCGSSEDCCSTDTSCQASAASNTGYACLACVGPGETCTGGAVDTNCCVGQRCNGTCCVVEGNGCTQDQDCCSGVCNGTSCCLPSGVGTHSTLDCCSGAAKERYCTAADGSKYYCGSDCL
ncbi:MAG: hypothetical protein AMXMBFR56_81420 [Polyangiaceae bacterium]